MKRGTITLLLTAIMLLALPAAAHGAENEVLWECRERAWDEYAIMLTSDSAAPWGSGDTCYGDQLTGDARTVYEKLEAAFAADAVESVWVKTSDGQQAAWQVKNVLTATMSSDEINSWWNAVYQSIQMACQAFTYDHPEYFWIRTNYGGSYSGYTMSGVSTMSAHVFYAAQPTCDTLEKRAQQQSKLDAAVQPILDATEGMPTVARVAYFENWLAVNNTYNSDAAGNSACLSTDDTPWSAIGALVDGCSPVCEGYAKAFQLLCHRIGVPCVTISGYAGGGHMWTAVQLGGTWYFCDPTFDDPVVSGSGGSWSYSSRNYFLTAAPSSHTASMPLTPPPLSGTGYFTDWAVSGGSITGGEQYGSNAAMAIALYDSAGRMLTCGPCAAVQWGTGWMYLAPELNGAAVRAAARITRFCVSNTTGAPLTAARDIPYTA